MLSTKMWTHRNPKFKLAFDRIPTSIFHQQLLVVSGRSQTIEVHNFVQLATCAWKRHSGGERLSRTPLFTQTSRSRDICRVPGLKVVSLADRIIPTIRSVGLCHAKCINPWSYIVGRWSEELMMASRLGRRMRYILEKQNTIAYKQKIAARWCGMGH